ncbi:ribonuclease J [Candidatus Liberibacter americanus]|uniref:Metallo-beta-lactamase family protein, RNA-specific n=1 Tax=Candidatus Liberibacter americanus str. Sao Paulo TaxID=1261131 RepID=U6B4V3_9HYPH|nr:ribonuclease J [Candidatus Liberibacter americanus]AHA27925.1 Metallo-beta-lactamase family protein, RNA-specific [Candidatus Liberibacter americanus str. Sao Paulo]EMS36076.1 beta-lactamase domain-containing protein [Candidatus Liberibacter americanus PW_SP]
MVERKDLVFLPLGGVGEIGMNMYLYGCGVPGKRKWIMVDCGVAFPRDDSIGVSLVFPDITFLLKERKNLMAIIITHAHEDHYGALHDLWVLLNVPVYASPFAIALLEAKSFYNHVPNNIICKPFKVGDKIDIHPFSIEPLRVNHSIPESMALIIRSPLGNIVHTGDWKVDDTAILGDTTDQKALCAIGNEGVLALMCDSTNAMCDESYITEKDVTNGLYNIIEKASGCVAITTFSSSISRICSIIDVAEKLGRYVLLLGTSLKRVVNVAIDIGLIKKDQKFLSEEEFGSYPRNKLVIILTGSQGEPRSALSQLSRNGMCNISLCENDLVIFSSRAIPGNETAIGDVKNRLIEQGVKIIVGDLDNAVHVSGHPYRNDLKKMYEWVRPQIIVPIHGEAMHLVSQRDLALEFGVYNVPFIRNGHMLRLSPSPVEIIDEVVHGRFFKDGHLVGKSEDLGISKRRKLSFAGHLSVNIVVDNYYDIVGVPEIIDIGLPFYCADGTKLSKILLKTIITTVINMNKSSRKDLKLLRESIKKSLRSAINNIWGKKPIVTVFVNKISY